MQGGRYYLYTIIYPFISLWWRSSQVYVICLERGGERDGSAFGNLIEWLQRGIHPWVISGRPCERLPTSHTRAAPHSSSLSPPLSSITPSILPRSSLPPPLADHRSGGWDGASLIQPVSAWSCVWPVRVWDAVRVRGGAAQRLECGNSKTKPAKTEWKICGHACSTDWLHQPASAAEEGFPPPAVIFMTKRSQNIPVTFLADSRLSWSALEWSAVRCWRRRSAPTPAVQCKGNSHQPNW